MQQEQKEQQRFLDIELVERPGRVQEPVESADGLPRTVYDADTDLVGKQSNLVVLHGCQSPLLAADLEARIDDMFFKFGKKFDRGVLLGLGWSCGLSSFAVLRARRRGRPGR